MPIGTRKVKRAVALSNIEPVYGNMKRGVVKGTFVTVVKEYFYNGETWFKLDDGTNVPSVFFEYC